MRNAYKLAPFSYYPKLRLEHERNIEIIQKRLSSLVIITKKGLFSLSLEILDISGLKDRPTESCLMEEESRHLSSTDREMHQLRDGRDQEYIGDAACMGF